MYDDVVSTGSLAAAAFETVGYAYQDIVISSMGDMLIEIGALIFVLAGCYTVFSFATGGRAKDFLWFLIGPAVFFFLLFTQVEAGGAVWQFGTFDDLENGEDSVEYQLNISREQYSVSWVFHRYNRVISSLSRELITLVTSFDSRVVQMNFGRRQAIAEQISRAEIQNGGLKELVQNYATGTTCMSGLDAIRRLTAKRRDRAAYLSDDVEQASLDAANSFFNSVVSIEPTSAAGTFLTERLFTRLRAGGTDTNQDVMRYCGELELTPRNTLPDRTQLGDVLPASPADDGSYLRTATCSKVWCWTALGLKQESDRLMGEQQEEIRQECASNPSGCPVGTPLETQLFVDIAAKTAPLDQPSLAPVGDDISMIPSVISSIMLRNAITSETQNNRLNNLGKSVEFNTTPYRHSLTPTEDSRKQHALNTADYQVSTGLKYDIYYMLMQMPYIQGIILYALAALFPFFCVVTVFPGYHGTIIKFFLLWTWAKSWDVGWAFVMTADNLLWELMPQFSTFTPLNDPSHGATTLLEAAFETDPTYSLSTYYMLVSSMIMAVPILTANALLGAASAVGEIANSAGSKVSQGLSSRMMKAQGMQGVAETEASAESRRYSDGRNNGRGMRR